jgi:hypothetical protein
MLELNIKCESLEEARIYLNATNYVSLLQDLHTNLRNAYKHGDDASVLKTIENFYPDIIRAVDHSEGAY